MTSLTQNFLYTGQLSFWNKKGYLRVNEWMLTLLLGLLILPVKTNMNSLIQVSSWMTFSFWKQTVVDLSQVFQITVSELYKSRVILFILLISIFRNFRTSITWKKRFKSSGDNTIQEKREMKKNGRGWA